MTIFLFSLVFLASHVRGGGAGHHGTGGPLFGSRSAMLPRGHLGGVVRPLPFDKVTMAVKDSVEMKASSKIGGGESFIDIAWTGVVGATASDLIAVTCAGSEWDIGEVFDAIPTASGNEDVGMESGSIRIPTLPDARCPYVVRYLQAVVSPSLRHSDYEGAHASQSNRTHSAVVIGELKIEHESGAFGVRPSQIHLSFTEKRDEMLVIWVSGHGLLDDNDSVPTVRYGFEKGKLDRVAHGTTSTYHASDMCNAPANRTGIQHFLPPGDINRVVLSGLPTSTQVFYRVGNGGALGWSSERVFTSRKSMSERAVKFLMYADQALPVPLFAPAWRLVGQVKRDIEENGFGGFLLHPGDLGYAEGSTFIWDLWGSLIEPISSRVAYMVTIGNHEYDHTGSKIDPSGAPPTGWHPQEQGKHPTEWGNFGDDSQGECGVPTQARYNGTSSDGNDIFWYSFNEGGVHVVVMSSEHDWTVGSIQYKWLANDLASAASNRTLTPWIVLATHRMMYTTQLQEEGDFKVSLAMREHLEPLLYKYRVNLMLVGHQHSYERSCPAYKGECVDDGVSGTTHIVAGSAGASAEKGGFSPSLGNFSVAHVNDYGYLRLSANSSMLHVEFVRTNSYENESGEKQPPGSVWDSVTLMPWT